MTIKSLGTAIGAVSLMAISAGCAMSGSSGPQASIFGGKVDVSNIGLATKAQMALASNDFATAVDLAEKAVERSPQDAGFRALLGNAYLASGRFASAESAYRDSLSLVANQPQIILKLALVQTARGKRDEAQLLLAEARSVLDPADTGLALALAGDPHGAVALLEPVARSVGADSRTRQNLALAHAFAGDWTQARIVASQDVPADQLDARIQQWMALASSARASDKVAAFIGIQPTAADPGQPTRLALYRDDAVRQAASEVEAPRLAEVTQAPQPVGPIAPVPTAYAAAEPVPAPVEPVRLASVEPTVPPPPPAPVAADDARPARVAPAVTESPLRQARPALSPAAARLTEKPVVRKASVPAVAEGRSSAVVQLGAYSSRDRIAVAWGRAARQYAALKRFTPVTSRFAGPEGTVYRLSVKGFASEREAMGMCASLKRAGRDCFVRSAAGESPVRLASR